MPTLHFQGRATILTHHLTVPYCQLQPDPKKSAGDAHTRAGLTDNLIIKGDNLQALKSLLPSFGGKVKCIYIDPPYNTGNEGWTYNDAVNSPLHKDWLGKVVDREDLTRHDKWLCMMYPRLVLLRELLRDDGVIFVSIDDNEVHRLRALMDEIFGEQNFIANIVWQKKQSPQNDATYISDMHDHIVVYARYTKESKSDTKGWTRQLLPRTGEQEARFSNPDNDPRGSWISVDYTANKSSDQRPNLYYVITNPNTKKKTWPSQERVWAFDEVTHRTHLEDNRIWWSSTGDGQPRLKKFRSEVQEGVVPSTWWDRDDAGDNQESKRELRLIFESESDLASNFDTPKPVRLIQRILQIAVQADDNAIILDSFAGSGTTAHAVLALNKADGGNRKFILVEQEDYADKITAERVRRVIKGVKTAKDEGLKKGLGGSFTYCTLGPALDEAQFLKGKDLPTYEEMARYVFFTATGEQIDPRKIKEKKYYLGESARYSVYMIYRPEIDYLKNNPLTKVWVEDKLTAWIPGDKLRLVIAPFKYLDEEYLRKFGIDFCQLPFAIYRYRA